MYKKMLFCLTVFALTNNLMYSSERLKSSDSNSDGQIFENPYGSGQDYGKISLGMKLRSTSNSAVTSFARTAACATALATILFLKDRSTDKEALPLLTAIMVATGIGTITAAVSQGFGFIADWQGWTRLGNFLADTNNIRLKNSTGYWSTSIGFLAGSAAGIYYYRTQ